MGKQFTHRQRPVADGPVGVGYGFAVSQNPSWTLEELLQATQGRLAAPSRDCCFRSISTDSRTVRPGDIFLALSGEKFDGAAFAAQAVSSGATALIVDRLLSPSPPVPTVVVPDTLRALGDLAHFRRCQMKKLTVVAITGSSGKTTVKEMTAAILGQCGNTLKTMGNFNNLVGLPLSLLPVSYHHRYAVMELGMNVPGEIARLTEIARPDVACINNIQPAHLAGLGSVEGVARAKGELFAGCPDAAILAVNLDDPLVRKLAKGVRQKTIGFGFRKGAEVRATRIVARGQEGMAFTLEVAGARTRVRISAIGRHNVLNSLAAAALSHAAGAGMAQIVAGLESFATGENRLGVRQLANGLRVINDSYNANPSSMNAALATVAMIRQDEKAVAVLGDMLELGDFSHTAHEALGAEVARLRFDYLCAVGTYAAAMVAAAQQAGMATDKAREFGSKEEVAAFIRGRLEAGQLGRGDLVLVKGSRGMRMEQVIASLTTNE